MNKWRLLYNLTGQDEKYYYELKIYKNIYNPEEYKIEQSKSKKVKVKFGKKIVDYCYPSLSETITIDRIGKITLEYLIEKFINNLNKVRISTITGELIKKHQIII